MLNELHGWCNKWRMKVNISKTKSMHFRKQSVDITNFVFKMGDNALEMVSNYKYLGCTISDQMDFTVTSNQLSNSAGRALGMLINKCKQNNGLAYATYTKLYDTCVTSIMDYCSGVWGFKPYSRAETIHMTAIKFFLGVNKMTSNVATQGDMGWISPVVRRHLNIIRLWYRLIKMDDDRLTKKVFNWEYSLNKNNWCKDVKSIFTKIGLEQLYIDKSVGGMSLNKLLATCQNKLCEIENAKWKNNMNMQPKLRTYVLFKSNYETELYVKLNLSIRHRSLLARMRCGVLPLNIETGRYRRIPEHERLCVMCDNRQVESETHVLFSCPFYQHIREMYILACFSNNCYEIMIDAEKLTLLMSKPDTIRKTCTFLEEAMNKRATAMYI